jgi:bifunctional polynucleotide phosphatase/kinase
MDLNLISLSDLSINSEWNSYQTISYLNFYSKSSSKIIIFDLKSLLFQTKSRQNYPNDFNDWELKNESSHAQLKSFLMEGFRLVVFTNDKHFSREGEKCYEFLLSYLKLPLLLLISKEDDTFAIPCTEMWEFFKSHLNDQVSINYSESKLILSPEVSKTENYYKFALNIGFSIVSPDFSLDNFPSNPRLTYSNKDIKRRGSVFKNEETQSSISMENQEVIVFVGPPGAGKSTFWKNHLSQYTWINCDKMRTKRKCLENLEKSLRSKKSCVIDNQNSTAALRLEYLTVALKYSVNVRCFVFLPHRDFALHLDKLRKINKARKHLSGYVGQVAVKKFYRDFEYPTLEEGFQEIKEIDLVAGPFENQEDEKLFFSYT